MKTTLIENDRKKTYFKFYQKNLLFICGLIPKNVSKAMKLVYFGILPITISFITFGKTVSFINITNPVIKLEAGLTTIFSYSTIAWFVYFIMINADLADLNSTFDENSPNYVGEEGMQIVYETFYNCLKKNLKLLVYVLSFYWVATAIVEQLEINNNDDYMHLFSCGSVDIQPTIAFCARRGSMLHCIANKVLYPYFIGVEYGAIIAIWVGYITVTDGIRARLVIYENKLQGFIYKYKNDYNFTKQHQAEFYDIIRYQQDILAKSRKILETVNLIMAGHVIMLYFFNLFGILGLTHPDLRNTYSLTKLPITIVYSIYIHYSCCHNAYIVGHVHDTIFEKLLDVPWYDRNLSFQKCYFNLLVIIQKNHPLYICGLYEMDLKFFALNMKRLYTLANLLLLKFKN